MVALYEKYRPRDINDVIGQDALIKKLLCQERVGGLDGQVLWLTGESGTGKTTVARIIAGLIADPVTTFEVDAQDLNMELVRDWQDKAQYRSLYGGYAYIVNEAHGLSNKVVSRLQTVLEDPGVQKNSTWIFTTTNQGQERLFGDKFDACPFLSRAVLLELEYGPDTMLEMAKRLHEIATIEQLNGKPLADYVELMAECKGNMRQALQKVASGCMLP